MTHLTNRTARPLIRPAAIKRASESKEQTTPTPVTGDQALVKSINRIALLRLLREHAGISRAGLSERSGLTRSTVSLLIKELIDEGWLVEADAFVTGTVGDAISGFLGGLLGSLAATPGAPVSIWCATKGWDKTRQRALYQPFIMIMQIVALLAIPAMQAGGTTQVGFPPMVYLYVPAGLIGTMIGFAWFSRMTGRQFHIAVNLLLAISGAGLLV